MTGRQWGLAIAAVAVVAIAAAEVGNRARRKRDDTPVDLDAWRARMDERVAQWKAQASGAIGGPSNVTAADYVGPGACAGCHAENAARWQHTLHATMNQVAGARTVAGDFGGVEVAYGGGRARFERRGDRHRMVLTDRDGRRRAYVVTRTIGSRGLQEYVGVEEPVDGAGVSSVEVRLPFGWWITRAGWYPQPYYDSWFDDEYTAAAAPVFDAFAPDPSPWAARCAWCHNTYPFAYRLARDGVGHGPERYARATSALAVPALGASDVLPTDALVTVGISCESCHLGGRAHAAAPEDGPPSFIPGGDVCVRPDAIAPTSGDRTSPLVQHAICAQCHSAPTPHYPDGSATRNSSEALDLAAGSCATAIRCVDCHDPHVRGPDPAGPDRPAHVAACLRCHDHLADPAAARAHSRHEPGAASCLDCHLPRIVQGIGDVVRSHRISSPGDPDMLAVGAPNACNLCHLDRSIRWTLDNLATLGVVRTPDATWRDTYGDLDHAVGPMWLTRGGRYVRQVAAAAYARQGDRAALPLLVDVLDDPVANTRMWILFAIEDLIRYRLHPGVYDPLASPAVRAKQMRDLRAWAAREAAP